MRDIKFILEGIVSQGKTVGSGGSVFRHTSSSSNKSGLNIGARRAQSHELATKNAAADSAENRENEVEKRNREAKQRQKETMKMSKEETVTEAKHVFHVHLHPLDTRLGKMVDDKTVEPAGNKPKGDKIKLTVPAHDTRTARDKATRYAAKNFGVHSVKSIEYKGLHEEMMTEAKTFKFNKPYKSDVAQHSKLDTEHLKDMHNRWTESHKRDMAMPKRAQGHDQGISDRLLAVHHILKSRGENVGELPKHPNLGMHHYSEETNTEKREKIENVARMDGAKPTSEKSTLSKTGQIKTKIVEEKPTMSVPNFGLPKSLIDAVRQIVEKKDEDDKDPKNMTGGKTAVDTDPETDDKQNDDDAAAKGKKKAVKEETKSGTEPKTEKEKKLAALASPKDKITHKDVLVGRGVVKEEEVELDERENSPYERASDIALDKKYGYGTSYDKTPKTSFGRAANRSSAAHALRTLRKNPNTDTETGSDAVHKGWAKTATTSTDQTPEKKARRATLASTPYSKLPDDEKEKDRVAFNAIKKTFNKEDFTADELARIEAIAAQLDEAKPTIVSAPIRGANQDQSGVGTKSSTADYTISDSKKTKVKEEVDLDEARGRPRKNPLPAGQAADVDDTHKHPMQQLEKIAHSVEGREPHYEHKDGSKTKIGRHLARHMAMTHNSMKTTQEKDDFANKLHANRDSMRSAMSKHF
jgi:hypothetical protein